MCYGALVICSNIAKHIKDYNMNCSICGALEDSVTSALLECPLATTIWEVSPFPPKFWDRCYPSILDGLLQVHESQGPDDAADFLAVIWEIWNSCNHFIFSSPYRSYDRLAQRAIAFIRGFREAKLPPRPFPPLQAVKWAPSPSSLWKLNFDAGRLGE